MRRAKIVCTIGPASSGGEMLEGLVGAGMDVARMNFSHGGREEHGEVFEQVRRLSDRVAVMQDLSGPKIRVGEIEGGEMRLNDGEEITLTAEGAAGGAGGVVQVSHPGISEDLEPGADIYIADGVIHLKVERIEGRKLRCRVERGGVLGSHKGVNLPGVRISAPALTDKDREDLAFGLKLGVDYIAVSFVRGAGDVREVGRMVEESGSAAQVVAKIEKREALEELDGIIEVSDALMIARGDLGVEIPTEEVPVAQKAIVHECRRRGKPVITATQMLESMVAAPRPTRAEASDVANAVVDGTDALMLSSETAVGRYPVESVETMDRIIRRIEGYMASGRGSPVCLGRERDEVGTGAWVRQKEDSLADAVSAGAVKVAAEMGAAAIACLTHSGMTAKMIAKQRPPVPVIALTDCSEVVRLMSLVWGVEAIMVERIESTERIFAAVKEKVFEAGYRGKVVLTAGIPTSGKTPTNTVYVVDV